MLGNLTIVESLASAHDKLDAILSRQMPDAEKRRRAHFLVDTSRGLVAAERQVGSILMALAGRPGRGAQARS